MLFKEAEVEILNAVLYKAHRASKVNNDVTIPFTTFRHQALFHCNHKKFKNQSIHLNLTFLFIKWGQESYWKYSSDITRLFGRLVYWFGHPNSGTQKTWSERRICLQKCFHSFKYVIDHTNICFIFLISLQTCSHLLNEVNSLHCFVRFLLYCLLHLLSSDCFAVLTSW